MNTKLIQQIHQHIYHVELGFPHTVQAQGHFLAASSDEAGDIAVEYFNTYTDHLFRRTFTRENLLRVELLPIRLLATGCRSATKSPTDTAATPAHC